jgi:hypothetical protein
MRRVAGLVLAVLALGLLSTACMAEDTNQTRSDQRKSAQQSRGEAEQAASAKYPIKKNVNFPKRGMLVEMAAREDLTNHAWYVYVLADTGNVIGYYVAETVPINACNFLSQNQEIVKADYGEGWSSHVLSLPSLDGMYYGNSECNVWVFQDAATGAVVKLGGVKFFVADAPLSIEAEAIRVTR